MFGIVFVLVGIMGFIGTGIVGPMGAFETNTLHDIVHLLIGVILLTVAFTAPSNSALWLKIMGVVYFAIAVLGFLIVPAGGELLGLVHMNSADHILHIVLAVVLFVAGTVSGKKMQPATMAPAPAPMSSSAPADTGSMGGMM